MLGLFLKNRSFHSLFWTQLGGAMNDNVFKNALVILITFREATVLGLPPTQIVALSGGLFILPFFLFSAWAGELAEKYPRVTVARLTKWLELFIMVICSVGFFFNLFGFLLFGLFLTGLQSTLFGPVKYSLVPAFVERHQLNAGNAAIEAGTFIAILAGTIVGGWASTHSATVIMLILIGISGLGLFASYRMLPIPANMPDLKVNRSWWAANKDLMQVVKSAPGSLQKIMGLSWFWFLGAAILAILPPYTKNIVNGNEQVVTLFLATFTIGIGVGAGLVPVLLRYASAPRLVRIGGLMMSLALIDWAFTDLGQLPYINLKLDIMGDIHKFSGTTLENFFLRKNSVHLLIDLFLLSVGCGFFTVPQMTALQTMTPKNEISRMIATNNVVNALYIVMSAVFLMAMYALNLSFSQILLVLGLLNAFFAIVLVRR